MAWPMSQDYNEAIQHPDSCFTDPDLRHGQPVLNALDLPRAYSGNFADVYELNSPGGRWAVKCFTREVPGLRERYAAISQHLQQVPLPFVVDFAFLERGVRVRGRWYPVVKMQWVEGLTLNEFVRRNADEPAVLKRLLRIWVRLAARLREAGIAHGDLQHGNVLLVPGGSGRSLAVKLVDYDGMWVPALASRPSGEVGHPAYQHPQRLAEGAYRREVDRFPPLLVATALDCLRVGGRALWDRYDTGDNLLFRAADLQRPAQSPLFRELLQTANGPARRLVGHTLHALRARLESVPLLEDVLPELAAGPRPRPTAAPAASEGRTAGVPVAQPAVGPQPPAVAPVETPDSAWEFEGGGEILSRRRPRAGMPVSVFSLAAAAAVTALLLAGGIYFQADWGKPKSPEKAPTARANPAGLRDLGPAEHGVSGETRARAGAGTRPPAHRRHRDGSEGGESFSLSEPGAVVRKKSPPALSPGAVAAGVRDRRQGGARPQPSP
jgi:hypothetical protein